MVLLACSWSIRIYSDGRTYQNTSGVCFQSEYALPGRTHTKSVGIHMARQQMLVPNASLRRLGLMVSLNHGYWFFFACRTLDMFKTDVTHKNLNSENDQTWVKCREVPKQARETEHALEMIAFERWKHSSRFSAIQCYYSGNIRNYYSHYIVTI